MAPAYQGERMFVCKSTGGVSTIACAPDDVRAIRDAAKEAGGKKLKLNFSVSAAMQSDAVAELAVTALDDKLNRRRWACAVGPVAQQAAGFGTRKVLVTAFAFTDASQCASLNAATASAVAAKE